MSDQEVKQPMPKIDEFDMDNPEPIKHIWIDRGLKMTCENAGHPYHEAFKIRRPLGGKIK